MTTFGLVSFTVHVLLFSFSINKIDHFTSTDGDRLNYLTIPTMFFGTIVTESNYTNVEIYNSKLSMLKQQVILVSNITEKNIS